MSPRARQTAPLRREDPEELTAHLNVETISRLKAACVDEPSAPASLESEETFSMVCEMACGSTARVYLAVDRRARPAERVVAVKRFSSALTWHEDFAAQFIEEMQLAASVEHRAVCRVRDFGRAGQSYYMATEFLQGETLGAVLDAAELRDTSARPPRVIASVFAQLAEGLHALHTCLPDGEGSVAHGDLSPRSLFVLFDGTVRVSDFGTAWARDELKRARKQDAIDHSYLAPELVQRGKLAMPDARSDVWALGVVLWEVLTGQRLFRCPSEREAVVQIGARRIAPPSDHHAQIPEELDRIVLKALNRQRNQRYASAHDLAEALERYLEDAPMPRQGEVAAWLDAVFPAGAERARGIVELANVTAARVAPAPDSGVEAAAVSGTYVPASEDETEHTTQIFRPNQHQTLRSIEGPLGAAPPEALPTEPTVSFKDVPTTVRRPRRRLSENRWSAAWKPFITTFSLALGVLGVGQALFMPHRAPASRASAPLLAQQVAPPATPPSPARETPAVAQAVLEPVGDAPTKIDPVPIGGVAANRPVTAERSAATAPPVNRIGSPAAATPQTQSGSVFVTTPGGGDIYDAGRLVGHAPTQVDLSPGLHTLVIKAGNEYRKVTVQVPAGAAIMVSVPEKRP